MPEPDAYSFRRYLRAKESVDDRARDRRVRDRFLAALDDVAEPIRICEVGAGTGSLVERALEWLDGEVRYTAVDADPDLVDAAVESVADRASAETREARSAGGPDAELVVERPGGTFVVEFVAADAFAHLADASPHDAVIAQAFLDLTDVDRALETVFGALEPGGVAYFPITFDGVTSFRPPVDPALDDRIERRFHRHMDETEKAGGHAGDSRAGRHLLTAVPAAGGDLLAAGGSDWVVTPSDGEYPADEAYFLHHLVHTVAGALADDPGIDDDELASWVEARHEQVADGELVYVAHQLDVLARRSAIDGP